MPGPALIGAALKSRLRKIVNYEAKKAGGALKGKGDRAILKAKNAIEEIVIRRKAIADDFAIEREKRLKAAKKIKTRRAQTAQTRIIDRNEQELIRKEYGDPPNINYRKMKKARKIGSPGWEQEIDSPDKINKVMGSKSQTRALFQNPKWPEIKTFMAKHSDTDWTPEILGSGVDATAIRIGRDKVARIGGKSARYDPRSGASWEQRLGFRGKQGEVSFDPGRQGRFGTAIHRGKLYRTGVPDVEGLNPPKARLQFPDETINIAVTDYYPTVSQLMEGKGLSGYNLSKEQINEVSKWVKKNWSNDRVAFHVDRFVDERPGMKDLKVIADRLSSKNIDYHHDIAAPDNLGYKLFDRNGKLLPPDQRQLKVIDIGSAIPTHTTPKNIDILGTAPTTLIGGSASRDRK